MIPITRFGSVKLELIRESLIWQKIWDIGFMHLCCIQFSLNLYLGYGEFLPSVNTCHNSKLFGVLMCLEVVNSIYFSFFNDLKWRGVKIRIVDYLSNYWIWLSICLFVWELVQLYVYTVQKIIKSILHSGEKLRFRLEKHFKNGWIMKCLT